MKKIQALWKASREAYASIPHPAVGAAVTEQTTASSKNAVLTIFA